MKLFLCRVYFGCFELLCVSRCDWAMWWSRVSCLRWRLNDLWFHLHHGVQHSTHFSSVFPHCRWYREHGGKSWESSRSVNEELIQPLIFDSAYRWMSLCLSSREEEEGGMERWSQEDEGGEKDKETTGEEEGRERARRDGRMFKIIMNHYELWMNEWGLELELHPSCVTHFNVL